MRTESVYLDAVSADGARAFVVRLQRNVDVATAWLWVHVFHDGRAWGSVDEAVACTCVPTDVEADPCTYADAAADVRFERTGRRGAMQGRLTVAAMATPLAGGADAAAVTARVDAVFHPTLLAGDEGLLAGRTERHGEVSATVTIGDDRWTLDALGQWHEQHQDTPRFGVPFTYMTIRGRERSLVGLVAPGGAGALTAGPGGADRLDGLVVDPPGPRRSFVAGGDERRLTGSLDATYVYELPIGGHPRASSIVVGTLDGSPVSGCINDWVPPR